MSTSEQTKILFISRAYPPITGGIENQNYELSVWLPKIAQVKTIANRKGKKALPFFLPWATVRALWLAPRYDAILLGDGVLGIVGYAVKCLYPKKTVVSVVHGLDLTFTSGIYQQWWVKKFLPKLDKLIAVGNETVRVGVERGIPREKFVFIPNGVDTEKYFRNYSRQDLERILKESVSDKKVLLTSGRLAKRKGVAWFIRNVLPKLPENIVYIVAGDGNDKENIRNAVTQTSMSSRLRLLGFVNDETRDILLNTCDLFIQPNIRVPGDMEGFGISVIEAASCQIPVIASRLEGLQDAIKDSENGFLVEPENANGYIEKIRLLLADDTLRETFGKQARQYVIDNFHWDSIAKRYLAIIEATLKK
ncbi:MAG: glycosyltransferase family 4 protein [Candidatus Moranbacteria bacterium]|nr:glycosyltransferase family 4 protein [Candidatus Moranbacteria bacterium]